MVHRLADRDIRIPATLAVLIVIVLGWLRIFDPFSGDQALFFVGAQKLHAGGVLYRDFWDIKQPGIFLFFLGAGSLLGFTQMGAHDADIAWGVVFSIALIFGLKSSLVDARWAAFAPLAIVGAYFTGSSHWHLLQVESLVGLPLFCVAWFAFAALEKPEGRKTLASLSGAAAAVVLAFKLIFLGIVVAVVTAVALLAIKRVGPRVVETFLAWWMLGASLLGFAFACYVVRYDLWHEIFTTFVSLPVTIVATSAFAPTHRLVDSLTRFLLYYRGIIFLALVGLVIVRDRRSRPWRIVAVVWFAAGFATILMQTQSWWQYHIALLLPPVGIYATFGLAAVAHRVRSTGLWGFAWLGLCGVAAYIAVPLPQAAIVSAMHIAAAKPFASDTNLVRYYESLSAEYAQSETDAAYLRKSANESDGVYVLGDPLIYVVGKRGQAIAMNGWGFPLYTQALWRRMATELRDRRTRDVFVVTSSLNGPIAERSSVLVAFLKKNYATAETTSDGVWLRDAPR